jgi:hypothetical protein
VKHKTTVQAEGLGQLKISMTQSGIEHATFRFVAQYLRYRVLPLPMYLCIFNCHLIHHNRIKNAVCRFNLHGPSLRFSQIIE